MRRLRLPPRRPRHFDRFPPTPSPPLSSASPAPPRARSPRVEPGRPVGPAAAPRLVLPQRPALDRARGASSPSPAAWPDRRAGPARGSGSDSAGTASRSPGASAGPWSGRSAGRCPGHASRNPRSGSYLSAALPTPGAGAMRSSNTSSANCANCHIVGGAMCYRPLRGRHSDEPADPAGAARPAAGEVGAGGALMHRRARSAVHIYRRECSRRESLPCGRELHPFANSKSELG